MIVTVLLVIQFLTSLYRKLLSRDGEDADEPDYLLESLQEGTPDCSPSVKSSEPDSDITDMASGGNDRYRPAAPRGRGRGRGRGSFLPTNSPQPAAGQYFAHVPGDGAKSSLNYGPPPIDYSPRPDPALSAHSHQASPCVVYDQLYEIEKLWKSKNNEAAVRKFRQLLMNSQTPYADFLRFLGTCSDLHEMKSTTLACSVAREFNHWIRQHQEYATQLTDELQLKAFHLATRNERVVFGFLLENIASAFNLRDANYLAISFCNKLLVKDNLKVRLTIYGSKHQVFVLVLHKN